MKKTATISAILAVVGFMAVYVALCYLVPGWRLKLHATAWAYFAASLRHMALLKGVFAMAAGLVLATLPFLGMLREPWPQAARPKVGPANEVRCDGGAIGPAAVSCALQGVKKKSSPRRDCCLAVFWCGAEISWGEC